MNDRRLAKGVLWGLEVIFYTIIEQWVRQEILL